MLAQDARRLHPLVVHCVPRTTLGRRDGSGPGACRRVYEASQAVCQHTNRPQTTAGAFLLDAQRHHSNKRVAIMATAATTAASPTARQACPQPRACVRACIRPARLCSTRGDATPSREWRTWRQQLRQQRRQQHAKHALNLGRACERASGRRVLLNARQRHSIERVASMATAATTAASPTARQARPWLLGVRVSVRQAGASFLNARQRHSIERVATMATAATTAASPTARQARPWLLGVRVSVHRAVAPLLNARQRHSIERMASMATAAATAASPTARQARPWLLGVRVSVHQAVAFAQRAAAPLY